MLGHLNLPSVVWPLSRVPWGRGRMPVSLLQFPAQHLTGAKTDWSGSGRNEKLLGSQPQETPDAASWQQARFWEPVSFGAAKGMTQSAQNLPGEGGSSLLHILVSPRNCLQIPWLRPELRNATPFCYCGVVLAPVRSPTQPRNWAPRQRSRSIPSYLPARCQRNLQF